MSHRKNHYKKTETEALQAYMQSRTDLYSALLPQNVEGALLSDANWIIRGHYAGGDELGIEVIPGDICYMDFGQAYLNEAGFQHFGLVINTWCRKALVIPMTSNESTYEKAWDERENPFGKRNLMRLGIVDGMEKPSVLFLNDMKFVNTARVIEIRTHIDVYGELFHTVEERIYGHLFRNAMC